MPNVINTSNCSLLRSKDYNNCSHGQINTNTVTVSGSYTINHLSVRMYVPGKFHVEQPDSLMTSDLPAGAIAPFETARLPIVWDSINRNKQLAAIWKT